MRAMTYLAVNHGAKGLIYYSYFNLRDDPDYPMRWTQLKKIGGEIRKLKTIFLSTDKVEENVISCSQPQIDFRVMRDGKEYYMFAVNSEKTPLKQVIFRLGNSEAKRVVYVAFENDRRLVAERGMFLDNFECYQVHVYHWGED